MRQQYFISVPILTCTPVFHTSFDFKTKFATSNSSIKIKSPTRCTVNDTGVSLNIIDKRDFKLCKEKDGRYKEMNDQRHQTF